MGLLDFLKSELIEIIEWTDDSRDTLAWRFPDDDKAIKRGAQLIVRESQIAQFVYVGEFGDSFGPGKHTLTTDNIPILTRLKSWKYGFESPFKADVYFVNTRLFTGNKWGTANPIMMRDNDLGVVRARAFGTYDFRVVDVKTFLREVAGSDHDFRLNEFADTMRSRLVSVFSDALATSQIPVLDVAQRYTELGEALLPLINPAVQAKYGIEITTLRRRERLGPARGRGGARQALEHGRGRRPQRLRQVPARPWARNRCGRRGGDGDRDGRRAGHGATDDAAARWDPGRARRRAGRAARAVVAGRGCGRARCPRGGRAEAPRIGRALGQADRRQLARQALGARGLSRRLTARAGAAA